MILLYFIIKNFYYLLRQLNRASDDDLRDSKDKVKDITNKNLLKNNSEFKDQFFY